MDPPSSHDRTVNTTPKAYKWRQPASDNGSDACGDNHSMSSFSQHSVSPTDVRLLFPMAPAHHANHTHCPRPHVHADGSVASAASLSQSNINNNINTIAPHPSSTTSAGLLSINSSFATAPQAEDDLSSMDDNERYDSSSQQESSQQSQSQFSASVYSTSHQNSSSCCSVSSSSQSSSAQQQQQQRVMYAKALPPLDSDESNSDDNPHLRAGGGHNHHLGVGSLKEFHILTKSPHKFGTSSHKRSSSKGKSKKSGSSRDPTGKKLKSSSSSKDPKKQKTRKPRTSTGTSSRSSSASVGTSSRGSASSGMQASTSSRTSRGSSRSSRSYTSSGILKPRAKMVTQATQTSPQSIERVLYVSTSSALHPAHHPLPHPEEQHPSKKVEVEMDQHPSKNMENPHSQRQSQQPPPPPLHAPPPAMNTTTTHGDNNNNNNNNNSSPGDSPLYQYHKSTSTSTTSVGIGTFFSYIDNDAADGDPAPVTPLRKTRATSSNDNSGATNYHTLDIDHDDDMDESFVTARGAPLDISLVERIIDDMTPRKKGGSNNTASPPSTSNDVSFETTTLLDVTITEPVDNTQMLRNDDDPSFETALDVTLIEPDDDSNDSANGNDASYGGPNDGIVPVDPPRVSGRVLGGTWRDSDGIFLDENNDEYMNLSLDTSINTSNQNDKSLSMIMEDSQQETSLNGTPYQPQQQSPHGVAFVSPQTPSLPGEGRDDMSFESAAATGDWKHDLLATRLNFDEAMMLAKVTPPAVVETRRHEDTTEQPALRSQTSSSSVPALSGKDGIARGNTEIVINRARSVDSDDDHEILVEPRRSRKPLVLTGPLRDDLSKTDLSFDESKEKSVSKSVVPRETAPLTAKQDSFGIVVPRETAPKKNEISVAPRKSKPLVLQGNLKEYMGNTILLFQSKDDLALLPQQKRQLSRKEIVVEPQPGRELQAWSGDVKEIMQTCENHSNEIKVQPRHSKPVVLRGNLNEYMENFNLLFRSQDDLHVLPRFHLKKHLSALDIAVEPFGSNARRMLSDDVTDIMPLNEASNEISSNARQSKSIVSRDAMDDKMSKAGFIFRSSENLATPEKGKDASRENKEILVVPQTSEDGVVSGDLQDYFDHVAIAFHESVRQSTNEIHDTTEATPLDEVDEEANDAYVMDTSSIVSLQEELALADRSFEIEASGMSVTSDEATVPTKNLKAYPVSPEEAIVKRRAKVVHLPFPWCSPELLFVPHNELKPPPDAMKFELPAPPINEEEELSDVENSETESLDLECCSHEAATRNELTQHIAVDAINEAAVRATTGLDDRGQPVPVSPDDVAILYRGDEPPDFSKSKRKRSLVCLVRSFTTRNACVGDPFCTDCGGPLTKCGCKRPDEDDADPSTRMKSVSDSSAKFLMVKAASTRKKKKKKKKKQQRKKQVLKNAHLHNSKGSHVPVVKDADSSLISKTEDFENLAEKNTTEAIESDEVISKTGSNENHTEADVTVVIDVDDFIAESEGLQKVEPVVDSMHKYSKETNVTAVIDVDDFIAESERLATAESLDNVTKLERPDSPTLPTTSEVDDKNAIVPHPPGDARPSDTVAMEDEAEAEALSVNFKKLPTTGTAAAVQDPSDENTDSSSLKSGSGSIKFVKVGKKIDAVVCCVEDRKYASALHMFASTMSTLL